MKIGFAECDVTPPVGACMSGYGTFIGRRSKGVSDPLMCRAVSFDADGKACVLVQCDLIGLAEHHVRGIRERVQSRTGLPPEAVMLHCSHTHSGPVVFELRAMGYPDQNYGPLLVSRVSQIVETALKNAQNAVRLRQFHVSCPSIGFNRTRRGTAIDHSLRGASFQRERGPTVLLLHHACHPVTLGVNDLYSADFPGGVVREMTAWGYQGAFLNGPCGDIDPLSNRSRWGSGTMETIGIYGRHLAGKGFDALEMAKAFSPRAPSWISRSIPLPLEVPERADVEKTLEEAMGTLREDPCQPKARLDKEWATDMLKAMDDPSTPLTRPAEIQAFSIGKVVFVALPGEIFTEIGLRIVRAFPRRNIFVLNACNEILSYIPTADEFTADSYAARSAFRYYGTIPLKKGAGEFMAEESIKLVRNIVR